MRVDHIAYRVADRKKSARFFIDAFKYKIQTEFVINFPDGSKTECIALEPPEKIVEGMNFTIPCDYVVTIPIFTEFSTIIKTEYHLAPEIFVSDGTPDSIVGKWVAERNGIGGIHHIAYQVEDVQKTMDEWKSMGYAEFASDKPLECPGLSQVFTKPSELTGVIYEFIKRDKHGFCVDNVKDLMTSTQDFK